MSPEHSADSGVARSEARTCADALQSDVVGNHPRIEPLEQMAA